MKQAVTLALAALISTAAFGQPMDDRAGYNYGTNVATRAPDGATGPGVVYTQRVTGRIISVGVPVTRNYPVGTTCDSTMSGGSWNGQPAQQYPQRCQTLFESRVIGWTYTVQHGYLQMQGFMVRQPQIGETVTVIVTSTYYAGS